MSSGALRIRRNWIAFILLGGISFICALFAFTPVRAATGINQQINVQGRLLNAQGATVPDGYYNIQFKIYQDGDGQSVGNPSGTLKWTETYLNANTQGVLVKNGFLSVQLGSVTSFGSSVDWNQDTLWLSMNIAGTNASCTPFASCSPDGEMIPMKRLSATPYALNSGLLGGLSSAQFIQLGQGMQTDTSTNSSIAINKTASGNLLTLQSSGVDAFSLANNGDALFGANANHTLSIATAGSGVAGRSLTIAGGAAGSGASALAGGNLVLQGGAGGGTNGNGGDITIDAGVRNGSGTDGSINIGTNVASTIQIGSVSVASTQTINIGANNTAASTTNVTIGAGSSAAAGSTTVRAKDNVTIATNGVARGTFDTNNNLYLGNGTTATTPNNFSIKGTGSGTAGTSGGNLNIQAGAGATSGAGSTGGSLTVQGGNAGGTNVAGGNLVVAGGAGTGTAAGGNILLQIAKPGASGSTNNSLVTVGTIYGSDGSILLQPSSDTTTALNIKTSLGNNAFTFDSSNGRLGINLGANNLPATALEVHGSLRLSGMVSGGANVDRFTTPVGSQVDTAINIPIYDPGGFGQILALGLNSSANSTSRVISIFDQRSGAHQPSIGVFTPDENNIFGLSTEGSNTTGYLKNTSGNIGIRSNATDIATFAPSSISLLQSTAVTGNLSATGTVTVSTLGTSNTSLVCRDGSNQLSACNATGAGAVFVQDGNDLGGTATLGTNGNNNLVLETNNTARATFDTSYNLYLGNGITAGAPANFTLRGTGSSTTGVAGATLNIQGGAATVGNANGGNLALTGGAGVGTGVRGLVVIDTPTFTTSATQNCASNCTITQANIDSTAAVLINATAASLTATLSDPTITTAGRVMYVTNVGTNDFTLSVNGGGTGNTIAMKPNTTATMIWNGADWTAAGASSSTDLQSAYNNTLTSAGGAELVLNASGGSADGLTIRNNATTPITGGILEVQSSIGTNLFSVNNFGTELAANGGSETSGTWTTNWTTVGSATISRTTTSGEYVTGQAGAEAITTAASNDGIRNNLSGNPVNIVGAEYQVSFTAKSSLSGTPIDVQYSRNGGTNMTACTNYGGVQTLSNTIWTKITCTITIDSTTAATNPDLFIRKTDTTTPTIWIDNLSFMRNDSTTQPSNVQIGGGINGGPVTLFTLDRSTAPPVANGDTTYLGSMYYDTTTGRIQCYEADGWGACGSAPNNDVNLLPEYPGAVLNGSGIGTMVANFCSDTLNINDGSSGQPTICSTGDTINYYQWTSPQASEQIYSIIVTHQLPAAFKNFDSDNTVKLTARTDNTTNGSVTYEMYRDTGSGLSQCGTGETAVTTSANVWQTVEINGNEATGCGFSSASANGFVVFKINVKARSNANVYVGNLSFITTGQ